MKTLLDYLEENNINYTESKDGLTVGRDLDLVDTGITELPNGLTVWGHLYLVGTDVTELPKNLTIWGTLNLRGSSVTELPKCLSVGGKIYISKKTKQMKLVIIESPFAGDVEKNIEYARKCMKDCFNRGEFPFASHLLYTQKGVLDDNCPEERKIGINAGLKWGEHAESTIVYTDYGISKGMKKGINDAFIKNRKIEYRSLY